MERRIRTQTVGPVKFEVFWLHTFIVEDCDISKDGSPRVLQESDEFSAGVVLAKAAGPSFDKIGITVR